MDYFLVQDKGTMLFKSGYMIPIETIDEARGPKGESLQLVKRGHVLMVLRDRYEWLRSDQQGLYEALIALGCPDLGMKRTPRALLLGAGMGLGVRRVVDLLGKRGKISVWDPVTALEKWNARAFANLNGNAFEEPGVNWVKGGLGSFLKKFEEEVDVLFIDEDHADKLKDAQTFDSLCACLRNGGTLAWWSAEVDKKILTELKTRRFEVEVETAFPRPNEKGRSQKVFVARLPFVEEA